MSDSHEDKTDIHWKLYWEREYSTAIAPERLKLDFCPHRPMMTNMSLDEQRELAGKLASGAITRDEATSKVQATAGKRPKATAAKRITCSLPSGYTIQIASDKLTTEDIIANLELLVRQVKKAAKQDVPPLLLPRFLKDHPPKQPAKKAA